MCTALCTGSGYCMHLYQKQEEELGKEVELLLLGGRRGYKGTEGRIKSHTPTQNSSSLSTWLVNDLCTFLDQYILYLAYKSLTPYHSICSWWHQETALRLPKRRQFTSFGDIWCISQSSQQARPYQKKSKLPLKIQNCAVYATTTPGEQNNRFPVLFSEDSPFFYPCPMLEHVLLIKTSTSDQSTI